MRVSVLIPCWNAERYVGEAVRSILAQVPAPEEVIAVDDGSTDGSADVLANFAPRVTLLRQQSNRGVSAALNLAIAHASGEAIAFLDADDLWLPGKLAVQISALKEDPNLDGVFGYVRQFVSPDLSREESLRLKIGGEPEPGFVKTTLLLRRTGLDRIGGFDESLGTADFLDWYARAIEVGFKGKMLSHPVALRRIHADNMGRRDRTEQRRDYLLTLKGFLDRRRAKLGGEA
jgi:glycosyltransferase involved in cell wall biosynthesis